VGTGGKSNMPLIFGLLAVAAGAGAFFFMKKKKNSNA
ncbi:LPXTG cell wall anchor domain-containing protein, partial [Betaproteobacteria bacterium PRO4]|nr:LPXTG cell wall anchor domain-containing protein [Betaproteobacteria bacterium PRO4]